MKLTTMEVYVHVGIEGWQSIDIFIKYVSAHKEKEAVGSTLHGLWKQNAEKTYTNTLK